MRWLFLLFVGLLCCFSCKKSGTGNAGPSDTALVGTWRWVVTYGSQAVTDGNPADIASYALTPANMGYQETLTLRSDNTYTFSRSNGTGGSGQYGYVSLPTPGGYVKSLFFAPATGGDTTYNHSFNGDTLDLNNQEITAAGWMNRLYVRVSDHPTPE